MTEAERPSGGWLSRFFRTPRARRTANVKFSAYLSIYNDWDLLAASLRSIAPYIDELVVVDGAYGWMVPYLERLGVDPERSEARVYQALAESGIPFRLISGLWVNEIDKRRAGFTACSHRYVMRIDADEIFHLDHAALDDFVNSHAIVGEMANPTYVAPGFVLGDSRKVDLPRTGFLFDRNKVTADIHLNYIWLVLTRDELPSAGQRPFAVYPRAIAFSAHLTGWRTPETAEQRSAFYVLNRLRQTGVGWFEDLKGKPLDDFEPLFSRVPAAAFRNMLRHARFSLGAFTLSADQALARTPLSAEKESALAPLFDRFLRSLADDNSAATRARQSFGWDSDLFIDLSTASAYDAAVKDGAIRVQFWDRPTDVTASAYTLSASMPHSVETALEVLLDGDVAQVKAPMLQNTSLRSVVSMRPHGGVGPLGEYLIL